MMHTDQLSKHRLRNPQQRIAAAVKVSRAAEAAHRYRPVADESYLAALSERMAVALGLPLATAKARVAAVAVSPGAPLDPGGDARWWKAPRSKP